MPGPGPPHRPTGVLIMAKLRMLEGIKVLDLTNVLSGPFATLHLALLGAEVVKVENPKDGDLARKLGIVPEFNKNADGHQLPGPERQQEAR